MEKYLVQIESGKNNIANRDLSIQRGSRIIEAKSEQDAFEKAFGDYNNHYSLTHFWHSPDWQKVTNIKLL